MRPAQWAIVAALIAAIAIGLAQIPWFAADQTTARSTSTPRATPSVTPTRARTPTPTPRPSTPALTLTRTKCGSKNATRDIPFRIEVDAGTQSASHFGKLVRQVLCHKRSWIASNNVTFHYDPAGALLIGLRKPATIAARCPGLTGDTDRNESCGASKEIAVNSDRWAHKSDAWKAGLLNEYRQMILEHLMGRALGLAFRQCPKAGGVAPVMMQQSKSLKSANGNRCTRNQWPLADELARLK